MDIDCLLGKFTLQHSVPIIGSSNVSLTQFHLELNFFSWTPWKGILSTYILHYEKRSDAISGIWDMSKVRFNGEVESCS